MITFKRTVTCGVCGIEETEPSANFGFPNWGCLAGIKLNDQENPMLCPEHLTKVSNYIDNTLIGENK